MTHGTLNTRRTGANVVVDVKAEYRADVLKTVFLKYFAEIFKYIRIINEEKLVTAVRYENKKQQIAKMHEFKIILNYIVK
jgi:hypothetical protein